MTTRTTPIYTGQDFYVPYFEVKLQGRPLGKDVIRDVTQVTYRDNIEQVDAFNITINNWDAERRDFKYSDSDLFDPGGVIELWMGYYGRDRLKPMITGTITALTPTFPAAGQSTLSISGQNLLHDLRDSQATHTYENLTDSQIARQIGARLDVEVRTDSEAEAREERHAYLIQNNEYAIVFLFRRAQRLGYELFVESTGTGDQAAQNRLYFGPPTENRTVYRLDYGSSLIDFSPNLDTSNQVGAVRTVGWDNVNKRRLSYTARRSEVSTTPVDPDAGQERIERAFADREEVIAQCPVNSEEEARRLASETHERIAREMLTASGSTVGLPDLRAGSLIQVTGVGQRFSGSYFVKATTHTIGDSGYTTKFDCRRIGS